MPKKTQRLSSGTHRARTEEKVKVITELRRKYPLEDLLQFLSVPRSTYYYYLKRSKKEDKYFVEKQEIKAIFETNKARYGYITIKYSTYSLVGRLIDRMRRHFDRSQDINDYTEELSVEIDHYEEKDYTNVDNTIERLGLKPRDKVVLDCYMAGMTCNEIAEFLDISRITVWRRRTRAQVKYKTLFN